MKLLPKTLIGAVLPLTLFAPLALAEEINEDAANFGDLDALEVTGENEQSNQASALRTDTPLIDIPQSLSVITKEQIEEQGIDSIADIIDYTPGVVNSQGEGHRDSVVFRGIRSTADFFVDGVRDDVQYFRSLYNIEQVEILRGPNALTFGRGGAGGILNRVLKKAQVGETFGEVQGRLNTFGGTYGQFDYNTSVSDQAAFRLNVFTEHLENHRDFFDGDRFGVNPTFTWELTPDTTVHFAYEYNDHERFIDRGVPSNGNDRPASQFDGTTFGDSDLNENKLESHTFRANVKHRFSDQWKGSLTAFYGTYDKSYQNYFPSDFDAATNQVEIDGYVDRTDRQNFVLSGDLVGEFSTGGIDHKVLIGAEYINTSSDQDRFNNVWNTNNDDQEFFDAAGFRLSNGVVRDPMGNVVATGTLTDLNDDTRTTIDTYSFFIQDEIALSDQWDLILGARFDSFDIKVRDVKNGGSDSRQDDEISPRVGLIYKPVENISLYASYSETFLPSSGEQFANLGDDIDPTEYTNLEAGIKWDACEDLSLSLAAFRIEESDLEEIDTSNTFRRVDSDTFGFEAQIQGQITDCWAITGGYTFLDGEVSGSNNDPREQPEHTFSMWNSFRVTDKLGLGLGFIYQDESFANSDNAVTLPSYFRVDAAASYQISETLRVQVNIENLLDRDYFPSAHTNQNITVGAPINASFLISKSF